MAGSRGDGKRSGAGGRKLWVIPVQREDRVAAILELGTFTGFDDRLGDFLAEAEESVAVAVEGAAIRRLQAELLGETRRQSEELQVQQEGLRAANEELEEQATRLQSSEEQLRAQQEELEASNEELEEKNELLERQRRDVQRAKTELEEQAVELKRASRYKSDFLANMSHELRTPLNSLLLLSRSLSENREGNLTPDQVESARVIHKGESELLTLINEILDLSKIEAGRLEIEIEEIPVDELADSVRRTFAPLAEERGLGFTVRIEESAPREISSDRHRLEQVLRNLIANALKFTRDGRVDVVISAGEPTGGSPDDSPSGELVTIEVRDTGIGIAEGDHRTIFEAFRQADASTSRAHGGTGLGLSIARQLTALLGGEIRLESEPGRGSVFTVELPVRMSSASAAHDGQTATSTPPLPGGPDPASAPSPIEDDRDSLSEGDRAVLIIEDDRDFAAVLAAQCREEGFKVLAAATGEAGLALAREHPVHGVLLDIRLPGIDGWRVLERLEATPQTRHVPVHVISGIDEAPRGRTRGAIGFLRKPVTRQQISELLARIREISSDRVRRLLVVEDDPATRRGIAGLIGDADVRIDEASTVEEALSSVRRQAYDCMILDLGLADQEGQDLLDVMAKDEEIEAPPAIIYTARDLSWDETVTLRACSEAIVIKSPRSEERLLAEVSLFLHRRLADPPEKQREAITSRHDVDAQLRGRRVLLVDDDLRTLFALTRLLSDRGMEVVKAENGKKAIQRLEETPDVDLVLMDIMMPELDGYETMRRIRSRERFGRLPIIALTAKAMKGDQEKCMAAGANDYLPKPVDEDRLVSMMRVWLYR